MTPRPHNLEHRILHEIATLRGDSTDAWRPRGVRAASIVRAYLATIDRRYFSSMLSTSRCSRRPELADRPSEAVSGIPADADPLGTRASRPPSILVP